MSIPNTGRPLGFNNGASAGTHLSVSFGGHRSTTSLAFSTTDMVHVRTVLRRKEMTYRRATSHTLVMLQYSVRGFVSYSQLDERPDDVHVHGCLEKAPTHGGRRIH